LLPLWLGYVNHDYDRFAIATNAGNQEFRRRGEFKVGLYISFVSNFSEGSNSNPKQEYKDRVILVLPSDHIPRRSFSDREAIPASV
jgi:hypothetical protein